MQKQRIGSTITKVLFVGSLMVPLVSHAQEFINYTDKNKANAITFDVEGKKDTLTGKTVDDTILVKMFDAAKNRKSRIILNPEELIEGDRIIETKSMFPEGSWEKIMEKGTSQNNSFFPSVSKAMLDMSFEKTKKQWGFCLTERGIGIMYGKKQEHVMEFDLYNGNSATNLIYAMDDKRTRVYHSRVKEYKYNWISACCEGMGRNGVLCQYLVLAFTNLYPGTPEYELKVLASMLKLPEGWKVIDMGNFMGMSACDALTPSVYFAAEDLLKNRYEILMQGYTYMDEGDIRNNVQVFIKNENGLIIEVK